MLFSEKESWETHTELPCWGFPTGKALSHLLKLITVNTHITLIQPFIHKMGLQSWYNNNAKIIFAGPPRRVS